MEFVQFHPTALYLASSPPFLLSEAMRGDGGQLRNNKGEVFMRTGRIPTGPSLSRARTGRPVSRSSTAASARIRKRWARSMRYTKHTLSLRASAQ